MANKTLSKEQLIDAAKMRDGGATWNEIRAKFGVKLGSSGWFRAFEREEIPHRAAGEAKPEQPASEPEAKSEPKATVKRTNRPQAKTAAVKEAKA